MDATTEITTTEARRRKEKQGWLDHLKKESVSDLLCTLYHMGWQDGSAGVVDELLRRDVDIRPDINEYCGQLHRQADDFRRNAMAMAASFGHFDSEEAPR
jgi:hypothetical protein